METKINKPKKIYSLFNEELYKKGIVCSNLYLEDFFVYEKKLYTYSSKSSVEFTLDQFKVWLNCNEEIAKNISDIIINILGNYIPGSLTNYFRIFNLFLLSNGVIYSNLLFLDQNNYIYSPVKDKVFFINQKNELIPFTMIELNSELKRCKLPKLDEKTFYRLHLCIMKSKKKLRNISHIGLYEVLINKFYYLENNSKDLQNFFGNYNLNEAINFQQKTLDFVDKLKSLLPDFFNLFQKDLEKHIKNRTPYTQDDEKELYSLCIDKLSKIYTISNINEEAVKNNIKNFILIPCLDFAKKHIEKCGFIEPEKNKILTLNLKMILAEKLFDDNSYRNFCALNEIARLTANISEKTSQTTKLHVVLYNSEEEKNNLITLLKGLFNAHEKKKCNFNRLPFTLKKMIELHENNIQINIIHSLTSVKFYYRILYNLFNNIIIKNADKSLVNEIHYVCFSRSVSVSNKLKQFYKADIITLTNFKLKKEIDFDNLLPGLNQLGVTMYHDQFNTDSIIEGFLNRYIKRDKNSFVLSAMLVDALKVYVSKVCPGISIKDYATQICSYIGTKNCYVRRNFSKEELSKLPNHYKRQLMNSKRPNARRYLGISFDYETFCKDFNIK